MPPCFLRSHAARGTPDKNSSRVAFPHAVRIWAPGLDWRQTLASIKPDPAAQRVARDKDIVPLRAEQLYGGFETADDLAKLYHSGELTWRFLPFSEAVELGELSDTWNRSLKTSTTAGGSSGRRSS